MITKFQKVINFLHRRFVQEMGREPATAKEIMDIQNEAVRYFNKTKGAPLTSKKPAFQGFTPKVIEGGKKEGIAAIENINNQFKKALEKRKEMFPGSTDKTLFKDSPKAIAKIKADNKAAIKRLKKKKTDDPENMADGGEVENNVKLASSYSEDWDKWGYQDFKKYESDGGTKSWKDWYNDIYIPMLDKQFGTDFASGGIARVGMAGGGILKDFIERLFIKASNNIRQGKGLFKGLTEEQRIVQHDNLTKLVEQFQKTGKFDKKANEYFGIDAEKAFKDAEKQVLSKPTKTLEGIKKEGTIDISNPEVADEFTRFIKESDPKGYKDLEQKIKLSEADFDVAKGLDDLENIRGTKASEIMTIKLKYPGISDDLIRNIMVDDNPQRKAEVFATLDEAFKMMEKGKGEDEIIKIFKDTSRTKQASGGRAGSGLNYLLGEDDQNVRMPSPGGLPGLLGE